MRRARRARLTRARARAGRFRDAEMASESIHSAVQLLALYHDSLLARRLPGAAAPSAHARYTRFWAQKSPLYRRVAVVLQMVVYTELLCEMAAKRRGGDGARWRVVVLLEAVKAACRLLLLRVTRARPLVTPALPERDAVPDADDGAAASSASSSSSRSESELMDEAAPDCAAPDAARHPHERAWSMPRTGMSLPSLPDAGDISAYLLGRVLTADDIKPAAKLLNQLQGAGRAAEVLHVLAPLAYAVALARSSNKRSWTPWLVGLAVECAARQLRDAGLRTTALERDEWKRRAWAMGWWAMRGACYSRVTKGLVAAVARRVPGFVGAIVDDYEYLWENYYFSTSP